MKLYHGTTSRLLPKLRGGILPRNKSKRKTNWKANPSHPGAVYLTNAYAGFYANCACSGREDWAILEIDTDKLLPWMFAPDEDFIEQVGRGNDKFQGDMYQRTRAIRLALKDYRSDINQADGATALSLKHLGNCTYHGVVTPEAITRVALVNQKQAPAFCMSNFDPSIVLLNYKICGAKYRNMLRWLFDYTDFEVDPLYTEDLARIKAAGRAGIRLLSFDDAVENV